MNYLLYPTRSLGINLSSMPCLRNTLPENIYNNIDHCICKIEISQYIRKKGLPAVC